ncbi:conserved hypothetical protein (plasmid) [Pantoea sp. At-9b]|nr:conserved hypothetical protein [Pantoea sp. At-9b]
MITETMTEKSGHLAWCALIALQLARHDGLVNSESQENIFLTRWLATALKQHRFPREVATDIQWLLKQGRMLGTRARLRHKLDYLWRSCSGDLSKQNDLFRLTYAIETAKEMQWGYRVLNDKEWSGRHAVIMNSNVNGIYLSRSSLDVAFSDDGVQIAPLMAKLTGNLQPLETLLNRCAWQADASPDNALASVFLLSANKQQEGLRDTMTAKQPVEQR